MSKIRAQRGLCSTCRNDPTCTYPRDAGRPVLQCQEFEGYVMTPPRTTGRDISPSTNLWVRSAAEEKYTGKYMGLCRSCENRGTCTFPKPEGGVWHCEEYR
mgnify:CR=1 FL=1